MTLVNLPASCEAVSRAKRTLELPPRELLRPPLTSSRASPWQRSAAAAREVLQDVAQLVDLAALDHGDIAEGLAQSRPARVGLIDHEEPPGDREPSLDQVGEQRLGHPGVLRLALPSASSAQCSWKASPSIITTHVEFAERMAEQVLSFATVSATKRRDAALRVFVLRARSDWPRARPS